MDVIGTEPRRTRRVPAAAVVVVLVVTAGAVAGSNIAERHELDRLIARAVAAQESITYSDRRVAATVEYSRPLLFGANAPRDVQAGLQQLVSDEAAGQVASIEHERTDAAALSLLPWHGGLRRARTALVTYLDARVAYLRAVASDSGTLYAEHPELAELRSDARDALRAAAGAADDKRIDAAFAG